MALFDKVLEAKTMSTHLRIHANVSKTILLQAYGIAKAFEARYSAYKKESFLNQINNFAGTSTPLSCNTQDSELFSKALQASKETDGLFDITIGALTHATYHFGFSNQGLESKDTIEQNRKLVNYQDIILKNKTILLKRKKMRLDVGGIGKGFVAKKIALFLEQKGASRILVDVGGEILTKGKSFTIALKNPFKEGNIGYITTSKNPISISTSGDYERFIDKENHHILHATKGVSSTHYASLTLIQNGWNIEMLDAYATALFNQPPTQLKLLSKRLQLHTLSIDHHQNIQLPYLENLNIKRVTLESL